EKISKSLGNFVLTRDTIANHDPQVIRFIMLSVHYRHPINFSEESLEAAKNSLERVKTAYHNLEHRKKSSLNLTNAVDGWLEAVEDKNEQFQVARDDGCNKANGME